MSHLPETSANRHEIVRELEIKSVDAVLAAIVRSERLDAMLYRPVLDNVLQSVPDKHIDQFARLCRSQAEILRETGAAYECFAALRKIDHYLCDALRDRRRKRRMN